MPSFPPTPGTGATVDGTGGRQWRYDGTKWTGNRVPSNRVRIGTIVGWPGIGVPELWLPCNGAAVSRTTYAKLFSVIGTRYGTGNGSTTFNVPDHCSRAEVGREHDTPTTARLTAAVSGIDPLVLGAVGGNQYMHTHMHGVGDPGHRHSIWDGGHSHGQDVHGHGHSDPGHQHHHGQHQHSHADPGHSHGTADPGHSHSNVWSFGIDISPIFLIGGSSDQAGGIGVNVDLWTNSSGVGQGVDGNWTGTVADWGGGGWVYDSRDPGTWSVAANANIGTGWGSLDIWNGGTGVSVGEAGGGAYDSQNTMPSVVIMKIIFAGA